MGASGGGGGPQQQLEGEARALLALRCDVVTTRTLTQPLDLFA